MSGKYKVDKLELGLSIAFLIIGDMIYFLTDDTWNLGLILSVLGDGGVISILFDWYYYNKKQKKEAKSGGKIDFARTAKSLAML